MKRIISLSLAALALVGASLRVNVEWSESELPHAYCYALGSQPANCLPRIEAVTPAPTLAPTLTPRPTPSATPAPVTPLLVNGDFESGFAGWQVVQASGLAQGDVYHAVSHGGATSLWFVDHYRCWRAGVRQTVSAMPLTRLRFSAWGRTWADGNLDPSQPSDTSVNDGLMVGLDPNGGTDYRASGVNWSTETATENWQQAGVVGTALGSRVTVFILLNLGVSGAPGQPGGACEWALPTLAGWMDDASLEVAP